LEEIFPALKKPLQSYAKVRGHMMAKAGLEAALYDAFAKLKRHFFVENAGGTQKKINVGRKSW